MRRKTKSRNTAEANEILRVTGVFAQKGEDLADNPRYGPQIQAARRRLIRCLPEAVRHVEAALDRADFAMARLLVRALPRGRFLITGAGVTLQRLGRDDLVERAMIYVSLFPRRDPSPQELARLKAKSCPRTLRIQ